jgi:hypothetical protein
MKFMTDTKRLAYLACFLAVSGLAATQAPSANLTPTDLRCEYAVNPMGVDALHPRLFWKLESQGRDERQTAYQILAASSTQLLTQDKGDLWDSRRVSSDESIHIAYAGKPLKSSQQILWKVRAWDVRGQASAWSPAATWTMGLLSESDWQAHWIGASATNYESLFLRREFTVKSGLRRALAHVCGLGQYEMTVNGSKAGDDLLSPGWTKYDKTCLYDTRDLTPLLHEGPNAVGLLLGDGMYRVIRTTRFSKFNGSFGPLKAVAHIRLEYADGSTEIISTDDHWRVHSGPMTFCSIYGGEDYDARLDPRGWNQPGFDDSQWEHARLVAGPGGTLRGLSCAAPPLRTFEVFEPASVSRLSNNVSVYDLGQNAPIIPRLKVTGPAGSSVKIIPAELIKDDGSVDRASCGKKDAWWLDTLAGTGGETWFPKFFYHGCRYLQVEREPAAEGGELPTVESLAGVVVHSSSAPVGQFACSNELFNRIHRLIRWAQRANMVSLLTDCPHRERLGWLEQAHLNGPSLRYEFDLDQLYTKAMNDMADSQLKDGLVPNIAPEYVVFKGAFRDSPEWSSACVLVPWQQYEFAADLELLRKHYETMKRYVAYLGSTATNCIVGHGLGDWFDLGPNPPGVAQLTPISLTGTAFYYQDTSILAQVAALLGRKEDAKIYRQLADQIRAAFNRTFYNSATHQYATGSQCANSMALVMGLVAPADRPAVLDAVVADVRAHGNALTAGDVGYGYLLRALAEGGRSDVIFAMNNQSDKPGYGYQLKLGATSLTESWSARRANSQNHFMLGQIMEWFYHEIGGIGCDPAGPGFKKIIIAPQLAGDLTWARTSYDSIRGRISSEWKRDGAKFKLRIGIPPNTAATIFIPAKSAADVTESGRAADHCPGVKFVRMEKGTAVYAVASGDYDFTSSLAP